MSSTTRSLDIPFRIKRYMSLVEQQLTTLPEHPNSPQLYFRIFFSFDHIILCPFSIYDFWYPSGVFRLSIVYKNSLSGRCVAPLVHATIILIIKWPFLKTWVNPKVLGGVRVAHLFSPQFCVLDCLFLFCFVCLVCSMLPLSLDCLFLIAPSVFSNIY